jgi:D-alanine-D-alanine ligase
VCPRVAILYNDPLSGRYETLGEAEAVLGVLDEVQAVRQSFEELGYSVILTPVPPPLQRVREKLETLDVDLVFNLFEGFEGRPKTEAAVADMLSEVGLIFTGCSSKALALALDKGKTKALLKKAGIETPNYQILKPETLPLFNLKYPCIVKPAADDASNGISEESVVNDQKSLEKQVTKVSQLYGGRALVEEYVDGREFNALVMCGSEPTVFPISEIVYSLPPGKPKILTYSAKWEPESIYYQSSEAICPAQVEDVIRERIADTVRRAFMAVIDSGYGRVDMRLDKDGCPKVMEVNPNPDISPDAGITLQIQAAGLTYTQFIERVATLALEKARR